MGIVYIFVAFVVIQVTLGSTEPALKIDNESELREAQAALFDDNSATGWLLLNYVDPSTVHFAASGEGTAAEVVNQLKDDQIQYVLMRMKVDTRPRNVFIAWIGRNVNSSEKRTKTMYIRDAEQLLQPFHSSITALSRDKFNDENIIDHSHPSSASHVIH